MVFISHSIEGVTYTTVYAHMSSRLVSSGEVVSNGQMIGYQGNSVRHLDNIYISSFIEVLEILEKTNAISPIGIVPL